MAGTTEHPTELVELPSGREVEIRAPGPRGMSLILGALPTSALIADDAPEDDEAATARFKQMTKAQRADLADSQMVVVCACSVEPRFTTTLPAPKGYTDIDDLSYTDYIALRDRCLEIIGEGQQEAAEKLDPLSVTAKA